MAWSAKGHAIIAQSALAQLPIQQQRFFNNDASALLKKDKAKKWRKSLSTFEPFAQAAVWPDTRRDTTVKNLFNRYAGGPVLPALKPFSPYKTAKWHYVNQQYWDKTHHQLIAAQAANARCNTQVNGYLAETWPLLLTAYGQANTAAERGLLMAFLSHLLADAYQPLHGLAGLNKQCKHDAGGNAYCFTHKSNGRCKLSLHRLWDGGFDVFTQPQNIAAIKPTKAITRAQAAKQLLPQALNTHGVLAPFIYSAPQGHLPDVKYRTQAAHITQNQAQMAASQLAALLAYLYMAAQ